MSSAVFEAAKSFRSAVAEGGLSALTLQAFPRGCCGEASDLLADYLDDSGLGRWTYCAGSRPAPEFSVQHHAWIERNGVIVDITADQFEADEMPPVVVGRELDWYETFELHSSRPAGLGFRSPNGQDQFLEADYRVLCDRAADVGRSDH